MMGAGDGASVRSLSSSLPSWPRSWLVVCALLLLGGPAGARVRPATSSRGPEPKDAEQRRALEGLDEDDAPSGEAARAARDGDGEGDGAPNPALIPDRYQVQKGDTLWDICDTNFHDPWRWPKIWALNPEVTNPHWIFPGQTLRIGGMSQSVPGATTGPGAGDKPSVGLVARPPSAKSMALGNGALREVGFVDADELAFAGTINGSREEKILLATGDQVYVQFSKEKTPLAGQRFTIYQLDSDHPVKDPHSSAVLGYLVRIFGDVTIDGVSDHPMASGTLRDLVQPVERGYRVGPVFRQFKTIRPRPNTVGTTAKVVAAVQPNLLIAEGMFVVLNRGKRDGVQVGNRMLIVRQGDGYRRIMEDWDATDDRFPPDAVGEVIAIDVRDDSSVAWVTGGNRSIRLGDLADMKKGY
jgi:hypothetical protein